MQAREPIVSNSERLCVHELLLNKKRLDGRKQLEFRNLELTFTDQLGGCVVDLGDTKVFSQVSCDIARPRPTRPHEGLLFVNLEFSPMASTSFEAERTNELSIEANRIIERCLVDSHCLDMESLCIISGEVVWEIRLDIRVLNHEGNLIDACCISAIAALSHFKRPDVTVYASEEIQALEDTNEQQGSFHGRMKFHSSKEKALVSLNIQHIPVCVTLCFYDQGKQYIVDPTRLEEMNLEGKMVVAVNNQKEVCTLHLSCGGLMLTRDDFLSHVHKASTICSQNLIVKIKEKLKENAEWQKTQSLQKQLESKMKINHEVPIAPLNEGQAYVEQLNSEVTKSKKKQSKDNVVNDAKVNENSGKGDASEDYKVHRKRQNVAALVQNSSNWKIGNNLTSTGKVFTNKKEGFASLMDEADHDEIELNKDQTVPPPNLDNDDVEFSDDEEDSVQVIL